MKAAAKLLDRQYESNKRGFLFNSHAGKIYYKPGIRFISRFQRKIIWISLSDKCNIKKSDMNGMIRRKIHGTGKTRKKFSLRPMKTDLLTMIILLKKMVIMR